jgi:hypothetical protein
MPKTTAIELTRKTIPVISNMLDIPEREVETEYYERTDKAERVYFVKDGFYMGMPMPWLIYTEVGFLENFASVPPGIEEYFVPVTQVKE